VPNMFRYSELSLTIDSTRPDRGPKAVLADGRHDAVADQHEFRLARILFGDLCSAPELPGAKRFRLFCKAWSRGIRGKLDAEPIKFDTLVCAANQLCERLLPTGCAMVFSRPLSVNSQITPPPTLPLHQRAFQLGDRIAPSSRRRRLQLLDCPLAHRHVRQDRCRQRREEMAASSS